MKKTFIAFFLFITTYAANAQSINDQLIAAVKIKNPELVAQLLKSGADANAAEVRNNLKVSALIIAVIRDDAQTVRILVEHKADVNFRDGFGATPLMYAAQMGNTAIIGFLLDKHADVHATDAHGNTVLSAAKEGKHPAAVELIQSRL